jgi:hypothetical protein
MAPPLRLFSATAIVRRMPRSRLPRARLHEVAANEHRRDDRHDMTAVVGGGEPPEPARSEPIDQPAKKQYHTERNKHTESRASEGIFAPRWHVKVALGVGPCVIGRSQKGKAPPLM